MKKVSDDSKKKSKRFKFSADEYIYKNIGKKWWAKHYKDQEFEVKSLKDQRKMIIDHIRNVTIDPYKEKHKNKKKYLEKNSILL